MLIHRPDIFTFTNSTKFIHMKTGIPFLAMLIVVALLFSCRNSGNNGNTESGNATQQTPDSSNTLSGNTPDAQNTAGNATSASNTGSQNSENTATAEKLLADIEKGKGNVLFQGMGTEPFWDIYLIPEGLLLTMNEEKTLYPINAGFSKDLKSQTIPFGDNQQLIIKKTPGNDGMSDRTYPYTVSWKGNKEYPHLEGGGDAKWMSDWKEYEPKEENTQPEGTSGKSGTAGVAANYICYNNDKTPSMQISISFDKEGRAIAVKYKGQTESMPLQYLKEKYLEGGAHPTIEEYYQEMYNGKKNGEYKLTHSGVWDYAEYTRAKDAKKFSFTINHDLSIENDGYRTTPCF